MSFILDALKKSENERQGQRGLGVADVPVAREAPGAPTWIWWLLGLLAVNVIVLLAVLLRPAAQPAADAATDTPAAEPAQTRPATVPERVAPDLAALVDRARSERPGAVSPGNRTAAGDEAAGSPATTPTGNASLRTPSAESYDSDDSPSANSPSAGPGPAATDRVATQPPQAAAATSRAGAGASGEEEALALPTLDQLRVRGDTGLPDLHLDIHVWSEQARGRFVYVNTMKYREGDDLAEGPRVASIIQSGVVLEHNGRRFLLPRE